MTSRKQDIRTIGNLIGNAAVHIALYPDQYKRVGEALLYFGQARQITEMRSWNRDEIERCRERAYRRVQSELRRRLPPARRSLFEELHEVARCEVDEFIAERMT